MQSVFVVVFLVAALAVVHCQDKYTDKYDNVDLDEILNSDRLLKSYIDCVLDKGKCSPDGSELKKYLPESLANQCAKCTDKQKEGTRKVIRFMATNKKEEWESIQNKYDPDRKYEKEYEKFYKD